LSFADHILEFNQSLYLDKSVLPPGIDVMNPFAEPMVQKTTTAFYQKYFADQENRFMVVGINPGRFGGGTTGIPFTDPHKLKDYCSIEVENLSAPELSADFIYRMIEAYGGVEKFYRKFFLTAISPLGFTKKKNGRAINYNYYDSPELLKAVTGFIVECITKQLTFGIRREVCFCLGTGKNYDFLVNLNATYGFFTSIIPLSHPRFVMQYRRRKIDEYISEYVEAFHRVS
jgi:hypothetical protein